MKLAIATGVLAQALPTFSQKNVNLIPPNHRDSLATTESWTGNDSDVALVKAYDEPRHRKSQGMLAKLPLTQTGLLINQRQANTQDPKYCIPASNNPDIGILSCGSGMSCKPSADSFLGGRCEVNEDYITDESKVVNGYGMMKKIRPGSFNGIRPKIECDPASTADIGILSCGENEHCVPSSLSSLGGFCRQNPDARELQTRGFGMCDPTSNYYMYLNCDCSGYDLSTGSGEVPCMTMENYCLGLSFPGCRDTCETRMVRHQIANTTIQAISACSNFSIAATTTETFCFGQTYDTGTCSVSINGQGCTSCIVVPYASYTYLSFDCTNVGGVVGTTKQGRNEFVPAISACYVTPTNTNCRLCTTEGTVMAHSAFDNVVTVGDFGNFSCNALHTNAYVLGPIGENYCGAAAAAATAACCDTVCYLCSEGNYIPPRNFYTVVDFTLEGYESVTCQDMLTSATVKFGITGRNCQEASQVAQSACCTPYLYEMCNVCDGPLVNSDAIVSADAFILPCSVLDTIRNDSVCEKVKPQAIPVCCQASSPSLSPIVDPAPFPAPAEVPVEAPVESPSLEPQAPSGTSITFPIGGILSTLGLLALGLAVVMN